MNRIEALEILRRPGNADRVEACVRAERKRGRAARRGAGRRVPFLFSSQNSNHFLLPIPFHGSL